MCGFVVSTDGGNMDKMLDAQRFRGPDHRGETIRYFSTLTWGHVLLDISGTKEVQPYITKKGSILVFNGEMYDSNIPSDTQFLAEGFEKYGLKFIEFTNWHGSFCFMNYQTMEMTICRDHFGAKPLWIRTEPIIENGGGGVTITTSLASFENLQPIKPHKNFWTNPIWTGSKSPFIGVKKVEPGQIYTYNCHTGVLKKKENLWEGYKIKNNPFNLEEFQSNLVNSIRKVAKNKQKTAIFLSGGLDSTCALGIVKDMGLDLTAYISAYSDEEGDIYRQDVFAEEADLAIKTCEEWGVPYKVVTLTKKQRDEYGKLWIQRNNYLWNDSNRRAPRYALAKAASEDGCKVVLTGDSADEFFSGYQHHAKRYIKGYNQEWINEVPKVHPWMPRRVFSEDKIGFNSTLFMDLLITSENNILATDQTCGLFGMESRPVYLSQEFARYIFESDGRVKMKLHKDYTSGTYKYLLRECMKDYIPQHILDRKSKCGWSSPWDNNSLANKQSNMDDWKAWVLRK